MELTVGELIGNFILVTGSILVLYLLLKKFAWGQISGILDERAAKISNDIDKAKNEVIIKFSLKFFLLCYSIP